MAMTATAATVTAADRRHRTFVPSSFPAGRVPASLTGRGRSRRSLGEFKRSVTMRLPASARRFLLATSMAMVAHQGTALAQSTYGAVVGVLTDASKAVVPGATVTLTEVQTNVTRTTTTGGRGTYEFLNLVQGRYRIEAELAGFQKAVVQAFPVGAREDRAHRRGAVGRPRPRKRSRSGEGRPSSTPRTPRSRRASTTAICRSCPSPSAPSTPRRSRPSPCCPRSRRAPASTSRSPAARPTRTRSRWTASPA